MEEGSLPARGERFQAQIVAQYGAPAYLRRAQKTEQALEAILAQARTTRLQWLEMVNLRLATLRALTGEWENLRSLSMDDSGINVIAELHEELQPRLRVPLEPTRSQRVLRTALEELIASLERFNRRWETYLRAIDLTEVNRLREGYNHYYLLEKECLFGAARWARDGFVRLEPLSAADLLRLLPPLAVPHPDGSTSDA